MGPDDVVVTVLTDSMELYESRLEELHAEAGEYSAADAAADYARWIRGQSVDHLLELRYTDRRRIHNLKYFTWVEQQGKTYEEILAQWRQPDYWLAVQRMAPEIDALIRDFNARTGVLKE